MNWTQQKLKKVEFQQELEHRTHIKTLNKLISQNSPMLPWVLGGHRTFSHSIDPSWKTINTTTIAYIKPMAKLFQTLKKLMWHLSNGRHHLKARKSFLKKFAHAGLAQSLFEGLVLLGVKPIRLQVNLCFHHSFFLLSDMNDWCPSHLGEQLLNT